MEIDGRRFEIVAINAILLDGVHRQSLHGIETLAASIADIGLQNPPIVTSTYRLVSGRRRLAAHRLLGIETILVQVIDRLDDAAALLRAEAAENAQRSRLLPSETVSLAEDLMPYAREKAKTRQHLGASVSSRPSIESTEPGEALEQIARMLDWSRFRLTEAMRVVAAARESPEQFGDLVDEMDKTGSVHGAYMELRRRRGENVSRKRSDRCMIFLDRHGELTIEGTVGRADLLERLREFVADNAS